MAVNHNKNSYIDEVRNKKHSWSLRKTIILSNERKLKGGSRSHWIRSVMRNLAFFPMWLLDAAERYDIVRLPHAQKNGSQKYCILYLNTCIIKRTKVVKFTKLHIGCKICLSLTLFTLQSIIDQKTLAFEYFLYTLWHRWCYFFTCILTQVSRITFFSSSNELGCFLTTFHLRICQRFLIGLSSGEFPGHGDSQIPLSANQVSTTLALW